MTHKIRVRVEEYAYHVNKLRQNVCFQTMMSQTENTKYKWPPYATDRTPCH